MHNAFEDLAKYKELDVVPMVISSITCRSLLHILRQSIWTPFIQKADGPVAESLNTPPPQLS